MKLYSLLILIFIISCKTPITTTNKTTNIDEKMTSKSNNCPDDGECNFTVILNTSLSILKDETGAFYPKLTPSENFVLQYTYKRNEIPNTADSGYEEIIYLELNKNEIELNLVNEKLSSAKLLFARLCFCRGQTGYYKIDQGNLSISKTSRANEYLLNLTFSSDEIPQIINTLTETFVLKN